MFLCETALGNLYQTAHGKFIEPDMLEEAGVDSVHGMGKSRLLHSVLLVTRTNFYCFYLGLREPRAAYSERLDDVLVPLGKVSACCPLLVLFCFDLFVCVVVFGVVAWSDLPLAFAVIVLQEAAAPVAASELDHSEFVVYSLEQVRLRFLVHVHFEFPPFADADSDFESDPDTDSEGM